MYVIPRPLKYKQKEVQVNKFLNWTLSSTFLWGNVGIRSDTTVSIASIIFVWVTDNIRIINVLCLSTGIIIINDSSKKLIPDISSICLMF